MDNAEDREKSKKTVSVTVGSTCFDALVRAVDTKEVKDELLRRGYTHLFIQMGRGTHIPTKDQEALFETLRLGKPLIVVVNEDLMDNHQSELAEELAERKHLYCARPQTIRQTIASMDLESLLPYHPGDATPLMNHMNRFLDFSED